MVIASGRSYPELKQLFAPFSGQLLFAPLDGAFAVAGETLLCGFPLDSESISNSMGLLSHPAVTGVEFCTQTEAYLYTAAPFVHSSFAKDTLIRTEETRIGDALRPMPQGAALPTEPIYKIIVFKKRTAAAFSLPKGTRAVYDSPIVTELVRQDISKCSAVKVLCEALHLTPADLLVFGDSENDRTLLTYAANGGGRAVTIYGAKHDVFTITPYHTQNVADSVLRFLSEEDREAAKQAQHAKQTERIANYKNHGEVSYH